MKNHWSRWSRPESLKVLCVDQCLERWLQLWSMLHANKSSARVWKCCTIFDRVGNPNLYWLTCILIAQINILVNAFWLLLHFYFFVTLIWLRSRWLLIKSFASYFNIFLKLFLGRTFRKLVFIKIVWVITIILILIHFWLITLCSSTIRHQLLFVEIRDLEILFKWRGTSTWS